MKMLHKYAIAIKDYFIDSIYPRRCPFCLSLTDTSLSNACICRSCQNNNTLTLIDKDYCLKCGRPLDEEAELCLQCKASKNYFDSGRGLALYDDSLAKSILAFKNNGYKEFAQYYAILMAHFLGKYILSLNIDFAISVPISKKNYEKRGYNQSHLIAIELCKLLELNYVEDVVYKKSQIYEQKKLSAEQRKINIKNAFILEKNIVKLKSILIIDDVFTTGSTINAISKLLKENGASRVHFVTVGIGRI